MYYKVLESGVIIDALEELQYVFYSNKSKMILRSGSEDPKEAVISSDGDTFYQLQGATSRFSDYKSVDLAQIDEEEYGIIRQALDEGKEIPVIDEQEPDPETDTLECVIKGKILELSNACNATIVSGVDIVLSDGESHHFSFEMTDQIMISKLADKAKSGEQLVPWHEDGKVCKFFPANDIIMLNQVMENVITYNITYFNSIRGYVESMTNPYEVAAVQYGCEFPREYWSEVLIALTESM